MGLRIFTEPQQGASYDQLLTVARTTEECGFEAFFRSDHFLKMGDRPAVPAYTDAWTTLAGLARDTHSVRLGTLVTSATFRPIGTFPVIVAQVDHMSGGRVEVGIGSGWYKDEYDAYGLPFAATDVRYNVLEDQVAILHGLWSTRPGGTFERDGLTCHVRLEADPLRPLQRPHPPIIIGGGGGPRNARLAATFGDEFNAPFVPVDKMKTAYSSVRAACEKLDRDPGELVWSTAQILCCGRDEAELARRASAIGRDLKDLRRDALAGLPGEILEKMGTLADAGTQRFYLQVLDLSDMDHVRLVAEEILPHAPGRRE
jgi:alkanesulfonate monooxygenase SsuD/methylene tetrahydromethanopterin reductase-like flavin-dependent oxidoreductase (luciferase family)